MKHYLMKTFPDMGLLIIRVGLGVMFMLHGYPKVLGGPEMWTKLGSAMGSLGINFAPTFWGFMAAFSEFGCGLLLVLGLLTKPASFLLAFTMLVATLKHLSAGDAFMHIASRPLELAIVFIAIMLLGAGKFSLDQKLFKKE